MEVNDDVINKLSKLSRLTFSVSDAEDIKFDLLKMINFIDKLGEVNTSGLTPVLQINDQRNVFREDLVADIVSTTLALKNTAYPDDKFFKVPKVIKK